MSNSHIPQRKRDRLKNTVSRLKGPSPSSSQPANTKPAGTSTTVAADSSTAVQEPSSNAGDVDKSFLAQALLRLDHKNRTTIEEYLPSGSDDIETAVDEVYDAAEAQRKLCEAKKWSISTPGGRLKLQDAADKILSWIDRFKGLGDTLASLDPVHAGLPWAGIRILLEATISASREMAALLSGLDAALYMMNRLKVYLQHFARLPKTLATSHFEEALILFYRRILQFLAEAIRKFQKGTLGRSFEAIFKASDVEEFENECDLIGQRTEIEAQNSDRELAAGLSIAVRDLNNVYRQIQTSIGGLHAKFDLSRLPLAEGARIDSYDEQEEASCLENTRVDLLNEIEQWAGDPKGKTIFWLRGMAGTGKSTISRTVARTFRDRRQLCASFFFKRGRGDRGGARRFFTTIAAQLARHSSIIQQHIAKALDERPELAGDQHMQDQFEKLVLEPLSRYSDAGPQASSNAVLIVIVIDALDECDPERDMRRILQLLGRLSAVLRLRLFITSRPDLEIRLGFNDLAAETHHDVVLHDVEATIIEHDIRIYFEHRFTEIVAERAKRQPQYPLSPDWPGEENVSRLVKLAVPLFIFAATACNFLAESRGDPQKRLTAILNSPQSVTRSKFDFTYLPVLNQMLIEGEEEEEQPLLDDFKELVGHIVIYFESLSANAISNLLEISVPHIYQTLDWLHSVLQVQEDPEIPIRLFHLSFRDFLVDPKKQGKSPFWINEPTMHQSLSDKCLRLLSRSGYLKRDCLNLRKPGVRRDQVATRTVEEALPAEVSYACRYWVYHLRNASGSIRDGDSVHDFLLAHFLHWMEVLSWLGNLSGIIEQVNVMRLLADDGNSKEVTSFLDDAKRFVRQNRQLVDTNPLQLYSSALIFAPEKSVIRCTFRADRPSWLSTLPKTPINWDSKLQELEGHKDWISSVTCSSDGKIIVSGSADKTVRLWDSTIGREVMIFNDFSDPIKSVSLSHDGRVLAGASNLGVTLWDWSSGVTLLEFGEVEDFRGPVAFSPNSDLLVMRNHAAEVILWDVAARKELWRAQCRNHRGRLTFSSDGRVIAFASDRRVILLDCHTGEKVRVLHGHEKDVIDVAFSPKRTLLASASEDGTVKLWNISTQIPPQTLTGFFLSINSVKFSHDGEVLAVITSHHTLSLWDLSTRSEIRHLRDVIDDFVFDVVFLPNSSLLAYASEDHVVIYDYSPSTKDFSSEGIRQRVSSVKLSSDNRLLATTLEKIITLWDPSSGEAVRSLEGNTSNIEEVKFSPDCRLLAFTDEDRRFKVYDLNRKGELWTAVDKVDACAFSFSADNQLLVLAQSKGMARLLRRSTGEEISTFSASYAISYIFFSPDSKLIVLGDHFGRIGAWDTWTGEKVWDEIDLLPINDYLGFSPDGALLAMQGHSGVSLRQSFTGNIVRELDFDSASRYIDAIAFSSDGQLVAVFNDDKKLGLWELPSGILLGLLNFRGRISSMCFSANDVYLKTNVGHIDITRNEDGQVKGLAIGKSLFLDGDWIMHNGEDSLWLPPKYRSRHSGSIGDVLIMGQDSGQVLFLGLDSTG